MPTRILIADDDSTIRLLLRRLLEEKQPDWQVCGEASNGVEAIEGVEQFEPDIVVMDLAMPVMNGLQAAPEIAKGHPGLPMLLPTGDDVIMFAHALELLKAFRGAVDAKWGTGPSEKSWLEAWWLRKFPANPLKWGSVLNLSDAEELLIEFRKFTEARMRRMKRKNPHAGPNRPAPSPLRRDLQPA